MTADDEPFAAKMARLLIRRRALTEAAKELDLSINNALRELGFDD
jgi:hypothetical protein